MKNCCTKLKKYYLTAKAFITGCLVNSRSPSDDRVMVQYKADIYDGSYKSEYNSFDDY